jgi:hypothetical protein
LHLHFYARTHTHAHARTRTHVRARTRTHAHAHARAHHARTHARTGLTHWRNTHERTALGGIGRAVASDLDRLPVMPDTCSIAACSPPRYAQCCLLLPAVLLIPPITAVAAGACRLFTCQRAHGAWTACATLMPVARLLCLGRLRPQTLPECRLVPGRAVACCRSYLHDCLNTDPCLIT